MIGVEQILEIIKTAYASAYLKMDKPINLLLIAESDSGKSQIIMTYKTPESEIVSDMTTKGLFAILEKRNGDEPITIIIPDFNAVLGHKPSVAGGTVGALLSLLEEGTAKTADGGGIKDMKGKKVSLITAMTPGVFFSKLKRWKSTGFFRRFMPIHYRYSSETSKKINLSIAEGKYSQELKTQIIELPKEKVFVVLPKEIARLVNEYAAIISERVENRGFTVHKNFRSYVKARALLRNSRTVNKTDFEDLRRAASFVRVDTPEEI
jgi:hypothetical protein